MTRSTFTCARCQTLLAVVRPREMLRVVSGELVGGSVLSRHVRIRCGCGKEKRIDFPDRVHDWCLDREIAA